MRYVTFIFIFALLAGCAGSEKSSVSVRKQRKVRIEYTVNEWDLGYEWAEYNDPQSFEECEDQFGVSEAEDGCNEYVQEYNYGSEQYFHGYPCTEDCSGHIAGYEWAEENGIDDVYDCDGYSYSFDEGCEAYVNENY